MPPVHECKALPRFGLRWVETLAEAAWVEEVVCAAVGSCVISVTEVDQPLHLHLRLVKLIPSSPHSPASFPALWLRASSSPPPPALNLRPLPRPSPPACQSL